MPLSLRPKRACGHFIRTRRKSGRPKNFLSNWGPAKAEVLSPHNAMALDTLAGVRGEMARLYRLGLNGKMRSDEMTRFIYALKEIRACIEAEILTDVQQR